MIVISVVQKVTGGWCVEAHDRAISKIIHTKMFPEGRSGEEELAQQYAYGLKTGLQHAGFHVNWDGKIKWMMGDRS